MINRIAECKQVSIITGHYGSGKTNFSVNLALALRKEGKPVTVVDLDIVNPYFRTADFKELLEEADIQLVSPPFANTNLDLPALSGEVDALLRQTDRYVILDVGGDDAGAIALGRYATLLQNRPYDCYYVLNAYRYQTKEPQEAVALMYEIERVSRLHVTHLINNSNLGVETTAELVKQSQPFAETVSAQTGLPIAFTCMHTSFINSNTEFFPVLNYIKSI